MRLFRRAIAIVLCGLTLLTAACDPIDGAEGAPSGSAPGPALGDARTASRQLGELMVASWNSMARYSRDRFPHWSNQGGGCDTRDVVLKRDGTGVVASAECKITRGSWFSVYDGRTLADPQDIDIDHMVPLANAWRTGASGWTDEKRAQFANDLVRPQLIAVTASSNRSKGDQDPSQWKPPRQEFWCEYAERWVAVKSYWGLTVTATEKAAIADMLGTC